MCNSCLRESVFESEWLESHLASTPHLEIDSESRHFAHLVPSEPAILWYRENCHWTHRSIWVAWRSHIKGWEEFNMGKNQFKKKKIPATAATGEMTTAKSARTATTGTSVPRMVQEEKDHWQAWLCVAGQVSGSGLFIVRCRLVSGQLPNYG